MTEQKPLIGLLRDKLLLVALAVVLVSPVAVYFMVSRRPPVVVESAKHLRMLPENEEHIVSRGLTDADLAELSRFKNLKNLELHYSDMTDAGMVHVAAHTGLRRLVISALALTDDGIMLLAALNDLEELIIVGCVDVTSAGLAFLKDLPELRAIVLNQCLKLDDGIAETLAACPKLTSIELESLRNLTDRTCEVLAQRSDITRLNLDMCVRIGPDGIRHLARIKSLEWLSLHAVDKLDDSVLPVFEELPNLKYLQLPLRAGFSDAAIARLQAALPGCEIHH